MPIWLKVLFLPIGCWVVYAVGMTVDRAIGALWLRREEWKSLPDEERAVVRLFGWSGLEVSRSIAAEERDERKRRRTATRRGRDLP